jgi:type II secretory pathway component PulC
MTEQKATAHTPGQWIIVDTWGYEALKITRVTPAKVMTERHGTRERHHDKASVLFFGDEKSARDLVSVLESLRARRRQAIAQIEEQHAARIQAAIRKATATPTGEGE